MEAIALLSQLAVENKRKVERWVADLPTVYRRYIVVEICRVLDFENVKQVLAPKEKRLPYPDLDLMIRGWNSTLAATLTPDYHMHGIPSRESNDESLMIARSILREMGISELLSKTVAMMKCGIAQAEWQGAVLKVFSPTIANSDHFFDQLDAWSSDEELEQYERRSAFKSLSTEEIKKKMKELVFPWSPGSGRMVGYHADPELDEHYLGAIEKSMLDWRDLAGWHPNTEVHGISSGLITSIISLLASVYLKHISFVAVGLETLGDINFPMSLTIWETRSELLSSLAAFTGEKETKLNQVLDRIIVSPNDVPFFATHKTPYVPMLIRVSDDQLLKPVSSIFGNPLRGVRAFLEYESNDLAAVIRGPREQWMKNELDALFFGNRYRITPKPITVKHNGTVVTDVDAAVLDLTSGELALFQLKWQDFVNTEVKRQRSQASNFIYAVDEWAKRIKEWIADHGLKELAQSLQLPSQIASFRLFAIGRQAAHFASLGFVSSHPDIAFSTWPQFVRLRFQLGPVERVFDKLHTALLKERCSSATVMPVPHEITVGSQRILFENNWYSFDEP
jgi:hypothetical protein